MVNRLEEVATKVDDMAVNVASLTQRVIVLEGKKSGQTPKPKAQTSLLQTIYRGAATVISSIPNHTNYLLQQTLQFQSQSSPIFINEVDIRSQLYLNRHFFLSNFNKPNDAGLALLYLLVGPELANNVFLPQIFYDIGPSARSGTSKTALSYKATYTWYRKSSFIFFLPKIHCLQNLWILFLQIFLFISIDICLLQKLEIL
jgi:hypothetical protein